jgi:hypothetical protein
MRLIVLTAFILILQACATTLSEKASRLKPISESQKKDCEFIKLISEGAGGRGSVGNNTKSATNTALNEVAEAGGDSYFFVSSSATNMGTSVIVEAYKCHKRAQ